MAISYLDRTAKAEDAGFQRRVATAMYEEAKTKASGTPTADDNAYIYDILLGTASVREMAMGVLLNATVNNDPDAATDAELQTAVGQVWDFYAAAAANG